MSNNKQQTEINAVEYLDKVNQFAKENNTGKPKQQTAVEWYDNQLRKVFSNTTEASNFSHEELLQQAKEMETEQNDKPLDEKVFNLANEFAVAGYGDIAVRLHSIHNEFLKYKDERIRR